MPWRADMKVTERLYGHLMDAGCAVAAEFSPREPGTTGPPPPQLMSALGARKSCAFGPRVRSLPRAAVGAAGGGGKHAAAGHPGPDRLRPDASSGRLLGPPSSLSLSFSSPNSPPLRRAINQWIPQATVAGSPRPTPRAPRQDHENVLPPLRHRPTAASSGRGNGSTRNYVTRGLPPRRHPARRVGSGRGLGGAGLRD